MKTWLIIVIVGMALITSACSSMFMVGKGEKRGVFLGSNSQAAYDMLCASGDLRKVLEATHLNGEMKDTIYQYSCSEERSSDKVKRIYASLTPEQKKDIMTAFKEQGFSINGGTC